LDLLNLGPQVSNTVHKHSLFIIADLDRPVENWAENLLGRAIRLRNFLLNRGSVIRASCCFLVYADEKSVTKFHFAKIPVA
jgi:hypothetical protein